MSSLRSLERSVVMHQNYKLCGTSRMFDGLWRAYQRRKKQLNTNSGKQLKQNKGILNKMKYLLNKRNTTIATN